MKWLFLFIAIVCEVIGTSALKYTEGFKKLIPSLIVIVGYGISFYFFSLSLKYIPLGVAYAIWGGVGIVLVAIAGYFLFKQSFDLAGIIGIAFILIGIVILNVFSKMVTR